MKRRQVAAAKHIHAKDRESGNRPRSGPARRNGSFFKPGETVRETGIYEVVHDRGHRTTHEAVMLAKDVFPACDTCFEKVRFRLLRTAISRRPSRLPGTTKAPRRVAAGAKLNPRER
jgi:hypothetical protein